MSFDSYEQSVDQGRPIHLYRFVMGAVEWCYTSADEDLTIGGVVYRAVPIIDDGVRETGEAVSDSMEIEAAITVGPAQVYMAGPPAERILVYRLAMHEGMTVPVVVYSGEVAQVNFQSPAMVKITCQKLSITMRRNGLRISYQRTCPYALYDPATCKVNKAVFARPIEVQSASGFDVKSPTFNDVPPGYYAGGMLEWQHPLRGLQVVFIEAHNGDTVTVYGETNDIYAGLVVYAYPGCPRTMNGCDSIFGNIANHGGYMSMPGKSPFDGNLVF